MMGDHPFFKGHFKGNDGRTSFFLKAILRELMGEQNVEYSYGFQDFSQEGTHENGPSNPCRQGFQTATPRDPPSNMKLSACIPLPEDKSIFLNFSFAAIGGSYPFLMPFLGVSILFLKAVLKGFLSFLKGFLSFFNAFLRGFYPFF